MRLAAFFLGGIALSQSMLGPSFCLAEPAFIENRGQWHPDVLYLCRLRGVEIWITRWGANFTFHEPALASLTQRADNRLELDPPSKEPIAGHRVLLYLEGASPTPIPDPQQPLEGYFHYLIGKGTSPITQVRRYREVRLRDIYPGIDLRYYLERGYVRFDFIVRPGADPSAIRFSLRGQERDFVEEGKLVFTTRFGAVELTELHTYQATDTIPSRFVKEGNSYTFALGPYNPAQALTIDPLIYSTFIGGGGNDRSRSLAIDATGHVYITGETASANYDTTAGAFQTTKSGADDIFVTKLSPTGSALIYSTFIGGSANEVAWDIAIDGAGHAYITGWTESTNYPTTPNAFQTTLPGSYNALVTKLAPDGASLIYSTYIGGSQNEIGRSIAIDATGHAYITGETRSTDFPVTSGAFQTSQQGMRDVFVAKLNPTGSALAYATYIGGSDEERGLGIAIDGSGNAYITGFTYSPNYPRTPGIVQNTYGGGLYDAFVTKLNSTGSALTYSTYLGGNALDWGYSIAVDHLGRAYIVGETASPNYPTTTGSFQTSYGGGLYDAFISLLQDDGSALVYSTYLGGDNWDTGHDLVLDAAGHVYLIGFTYSANFPTTSDAFQPTLQGDCDVFLAKLSAAGDALLHATYFGGNRDDVGRALALDAAGAMYFTGWTASDNFPTSSGAYQGQREGLLEVFVSKLETSTPTDISPGFGLPPTGWRVYPNPTTGTFTLEPGSFRRFELIDANGRQLRTYAPLGPTSFTELLPNGLYLIREPSTGTTQKLHIQR